MNETAIMARIALLKTRPTNNTRIIAKLERQLRKIRHEK